MEIEAKFIILNPQTHQILKTLLALGHYAITVGHRHTIVDTYMDTDDYRVLAEGYALRQRALEDGRYRFTLKSLYGSVSEAVHHREELEVMLDEPRPLAQWPVSALRERVYDVIKSASLAPLFCLRQSRLVRQIKQNDQVIAEFSLDDVLLNHETGSEQRQELEVELKDAGTEADLRSIVEHLTALAGLEPTTGSKFEWALTMFRTATLPLQPGIEPDDTVVEAARKLFDYHFRRMLAHEPGTRLGHDIEALHDMRVATRRMRTVFEVFGEDLDMKALKSYRKALRRLGRVLGSVRDMDILRTKTQMYLAAQTGQVATHDIEPLKRAWDAAYIYAREHLIDHLNSKRYQRFKAAFAEALASPLPTRTVVPRSVREAAPQVIEQLWETLLDRKARVAAPEASLADYHQLRIAAKHVRYTLEYFREVLGPSTETVIAMIKRLQDHLGALQDAVVACERLHHILDWGTWEQPGDATLRWAQAPIQAPGVADYLATRESEIETLRRTFPEAWATFEATPIEALMDEALAALTSDTIAISHTKENSMSQEPKYIILLGPPASGKGTQASKLREHLDLPHVASGDLFRYNLKNETELGMKAKTYMDRGELVPDDITIAMVLDRLERPDCAGGALLDGFPRTLAQAEALDEALAEKGTRISRVLNIQVPDEELVNRLSGRLICRECQEPFHKIHKPFKECPYGKCHGEHLYQRDDDKPETVRNRLKVYWEQTSPLIDYYREKGVLVDIDGNQSIDEVTVALKEAVSDLIE